MRQNEAELSHIPCIERLVPVELDVAHHGVYLELSQHLVSQKMQIKKLSKELKSDRSDRLNESLENSATAEEAFLKPALSFETEDGESGLESLIDKRTRQLDQTKHELMNLLAGLEGLMIVERERLEEDVEKEDKKSSSKEPSIIDLSGRYKTDITQHNWLGDADATRSMRSLLAVAKKSPRPAVSLKWRTHQA